MVDAVKLTLDAEDLSSEDRPGSGDVICCEVTATSKAQNHTTQTHSDGLQHKGTMSTKPVFKKIAKIQRSYVPVLWTYDICAFDTGTYYDYD